MQAYARLFSLPRVRGLLLVALLGRLPISVNSLTVLLLIHRETGSVGAAGLVVAAMTLGTAIGSPIQGRLIDRKGYSVLIWAATLHCAAIATLLIRSSSDVPLAQMATVGFIMGSAFPPTGSAVRAVWPRVLGAEPGALATVYAIDSVVFEIGFVAGPLLTAGILLVAGPAVALAISGACALAGAGGLSMALPRELHKADPLGRRRTDAGMKSASGGLAVVILATIPIGFLIGTIHVALPTLGALRGSESLGGALLAAWSGASGLAGLIYGARPQRHELLQDHLKFSILLPLACLPLAFATSPPVAIGMAALAGLPLAPVVATRNELIARLAPEDAMAEAFTWVLTALIIGSSAGSFAAGHLAESFSWQTAALVGPAVALLGVGPILAKQSALARAASRKPDPIDD